MIYYLSLYPFGCFLCQFQAVAIISSNSACSGFHPKIFRALLLDAINFIKFDLEENPTKYQEILQGLNYVKTKEEELLKSFSIFPKYVQ